MFLANLVGLYGNLNRDNSYLLLTEAARGIALGFDVNLLSIGFLFLLDFFWLIFAFYSQRFLHLSEAKNASELKSFFALIIAFVNLVIISKNLLSILFFYNCLIILCHFFAVKFLHKKQSKFSHFFTFLLYLESIFLFLAIVATYKFTGQIEFVEGGIMSGALDSAKYNLLLAMYLGGLFLAVLLPSHLFYREINLNPLVIYSLFFLAYGLSTLYIFIKLLGFVFGFKEFVLMSDVFLQIIELIFLVNIVATSIFLVFSKGLKSSFFYLFFQQFLFTLFAIFIFALFDKSRICLALFSFLLSLTLIFLCVSNFVLYLSKSGEKWLSGLFHNLKITSILFVFGILNLIGIAPGIGAVENFFLLKIIWQKKLIIPEIIFVVNALALVLFAVKIFYPLFSRDETSEAAKKIAEEIDYDSSLILTTLTLAIAIFFGLIFFPLLGSFL